MLETKQINVTYLETVRIKKHSLCLTPPFVCADWVNSMETRVRPENITRHVQVDTCCPGYEARAGQCEPRCSAGCVHGVCEEPEVCSCLPGFSGFSCDNVGCDQGWWGPGCEEQCECEHGGWCDPVTGACHCTPGYTGDTCADPCPSSSWGDSCAEECRCSTGETCHHVTGDCSPCRSGLFGEDCSQECQCHSEGTELCSHVDGRCFCKGNWFGLLCDQYCPFGWTDSTCHVSALDNGSCSCATDLYTCDPVLGCVCPGEDCGVELINSQVRLSPYHDHDSGGGDQQTATISLSVILVAGAAIVLIVVYYRRRLSVVRKDLQNR